MDLPVHPDKYSGNFPSFRQPVKIGEFSLDDQRHFCHDNSQQKFMSWPFDKPLENGQDIDVHFDLNLMINKAVTKDELQLDERLDNLLQWVLKNQDKFQLQGDKGSLKSLSTNFVCYRGLLTKLMTTPYENREPWIICASKWRDTIYLYAFDTEEKEAERLRQTPRQKAMASWGYKFEQYMMSDKAGGRPPDPHVPVVETEEFCCVVRSRLGQHSLVYGAEVDGLDLTAPGNPSAMSRFVELKTSRHVENQRQRNTLQRFKMLKWWAQSFLIGIEKIVVGFRDDEGIVDRLHAYGTAQLPKQQEFWSPAVCMNFAAAFLAFCSRHVTGDDPRAVWRFDYEPRAGRVTCRPLGTSDRYRVLPDWYTEQLFSADGSH